MKVVAHRIVDEPLDRRRLPPRLVPEHKVIVPPPLHPVRRRGRARVRRGDAGRVGQQRVVAEEAAGAAAAIAVAAVAVGVRVGGGARPLRRPLRLDELELPQQLRVVVVVVIVITVIVVIVVVAVANVPVLATSASGSAVAGTRVTADTTNTTKPPGTTGP